MRRLIPTTIAAVAALFSTAALAADMGPPVLRESLPAAQPVDDGGWYLRGDIGVAAHAIGDWGVFQNGARVRAGNGLTTRYDLRSKSSSESVSIGLGAGYRFTSWFRADATAELRVGSRLRALDYVEFGGGATMTNNYDGSLRSWVFLANGYLDLGTFCTLGCLTPYVGAGAGFAVHTISGFTDTSSGVGSLGGYAASTSRTSFAWALMAGVGYKVNERLTLELGYRYLSMGNLPMLSLLDPATGRAPASRDAVQVTNLTAHEIKVGMRWSLNCSCAVPAEPIVARY